MDTLLLVHPYGHYDNGVTAADVEHTVETFDGEVAALLSRSMVNDAGRYDGDIAGMVTAAEMREPVHGGLDAYDSLYLDCLGTGVPDEQSRQDLAAYERLLLGGGYTGYMTDEEHNAGCLMRCYDILQGDVEIDIVPELTYCDVPVPHEQNGRTILERGDAVVTVADMLAEQPVTGGNGDEIPITALRDYALRQFDWDTTDLVSVVERESFSR